MAEMQSGSEKIDNQCTDEFVPVDLNEALCSVEADEYFMNIKEELNQVDRLVGRSRYRGEMLPINLIQSHNSSSPRKGFFVL